MENFLTAAVYLFGAVGYESFSTSAKFSVCWFFWPARTGNLKQCGPRSAVFASDRQHPEMERMTAAEALLFENRLKSAVKHSYKSTPTYRGKEIVFTICQYFFL